MKRITQLAVASALAVAMASPSFAADLPRPAYKAPVYVAPFSWTGFYLGANVGYGFGKSSWSNALGTTGDFDTKGWLFGGTLGYNLQTGNWVWGLETDLAYTTMKGSTNTFCGAPGCETKINYFGTGRGRIGYAWDRWLPYITGGLAYGGVKMTNAAGTSETKTKLGYTIGGGVEYAFLGSWSAKLEYLYADLGKTECGTTVCGIATDVKFKSHIVRGGLNYRF